MFPLRLRFFGLFDFKGISALCATTVFFVALGLDASSSNVEAALTLDKMIVSADKYRTMAETPQSVVFIEPQQWQGSVKSIADIIAEQTGVQTRRFGGIGSFQTISIRAIEGSEVLVLIDGIAVNSAMGGAVDLGKLNPAWFDRIEVYRSFIPARFGGNGLGGVINLISASRKNDSGANIYSAIGNYNSKEFQIAASHWPNESFNNLVLLSYTESENEFPYLDRNNTWYNPTDDTKRLMENNQYYVGYFMIHPLIRLNNGVRLNTIVSTSSFKAHQPAPEGYQNKTAYNSGKSLDFNFRLENISLSEKLFIEPAAAYLLRQANRFYTSLDSAVGSSHSSLTHPNSFAKLSSDEYIMVMPVIITVIPNELLLFESCLSATYADVNPRVNTTGGIHGDWHSSEASFSAAIDATVRAGPLSCSGGGSIKTVYSETEGGLDGYTNRIVPASDTTTLLWSVKAGLSLRCADSAALVYMNAGRFSNHPSLRQRYGAQGAHNPNPTLVAETGFAAETGVKLLYTSLYLDLCGFFNRTWNKIITVFDGNQSASINCAGTRAYGFETSCVFTIRSYLQLDTRLTLQHTENLTRTNNWYGNRLPDEPPININESVVIGPWKGLSFRYGAELNSAYYRDLANTEGFRVPQRQNGKENEFWEVFHNLKLEWTPTDYLTLAVAATRLTSEVLLLQENISTKESGYQWILCPANQFMFSMAYSF